MSWKRIAGAEPRKKRRPGVLPVRLKAERGPSTPRLARRTNYMSYSLFEFIL